MLDGAKKHFGFGYMRLPMNGDEVDIEQTKQMVDYFLENGFNYFDTVHGYLEGKSEKAIKTCLADRHKRDEFILTNKLTNFYFKKEEDIRPLFEQQLEACGVEYFDYYLMHAQSAEIFKYFKERHAYETAFALKEEGKINMWEFPSTTEQKFWMRSLPSIRRSKWFRSSLTIWIMRTRQYRVKNATKSVVSTTSRCLLWSL